MYHFNTIKFIYSNKLLETMKKLVALLNGKQHTKIRKVDTQARSLEKRLMK